MKEYIGKWVTANTLLSEMGSRWSLEGFSSPRSLALFMKRYRFDKRKNKDNVTEYYITEDKIDKVEEKPYQPKDKENRGDK